MSYRNDNRTRRAGWIPKPLYVQLKRLERQIEQIHGTQRTEEMFHRMEREGALRDREFRTQAVLDRLRRRRR